MKIVLIIVNLALVTSLSNLMAGELNMEKNSLSLSDYYQRVLDYYPILKKQKAVTDGANESKLLASSFQLPRVMMNSSYIYSNDPVTVFGTLLRQNKFTQNNFDLDQLNNPDPVKNLNMTFYAEVPFFDAYQTKYSIHSAEYWIESSTNSEKLIRQQILAVSSEAFIQTLLSHKLFMITKKTLEAALKDMKQADELKKKGVILGADFFAAKVMLSDIQQMRNQSESQVKVSGAVFNLLMGENPKRPVFSKGGLSKALTVIPDLDQLLARYLEMRPDLKALQSAIKAKEFEVEKEKSSRLPKISAFASAEANTEKFNGIENNYTAGIKGSLDLYDPSYVSRTRKLELHLDELKNDEVLLKDELAQKLIEVYEEYHTLVQNLKVAHQSLLDSKESLKLLEPLYSEGKKSIADLLEIRAVSLNAEKSYFKTLFFAEIKSIHLLFCAGLLEKTHIDELSTHITEVN